MQGLGSWIGELKKWQAAVNRRLKPVVDKASLAVKNSAEYLSANRKLKISLILIGIPLVFFVMMIMVVIIDTPGKDVLRGFRNPIPSEIYTADSVLMGRYYIQDRTPVKFDDIAPSVIDAVISTEDVRFYSHHGVDFRSLGRVLIKTILLQDESSGGGSTITQQLAKNIFPRKDYLIMSVFINKLREAVIASRLENIYSKNEILTLYLNTVPFGDNTFGLQAAAHRFFSIDTKALSADQAAMLVGMLKANHNYNPRLFPSSALARRNIVLAQMKKYNAIPSHQADSLQKLPLGLKLGEVTYDHEIAPYFREHLKVEIQKWCTRNRKDDGSVYNLYTDGLKIYTTIDSKLQAYAEKAVTRHMAELQKQFFDHWGKEKPWQDNEAVVVDASRRSSRYKDLKRQGLSEDEIIREMSKAVPIRLFTWKGVMQANVSPIDSIKHHLQYLNAGFLAMEPNTGEVKAWVGGIDHDFFQYDHVKVSTKRQVGSIFKPLVYAQAIEEGVSPCELISAEQQTYIDEETGQEWTPRNSQYDYPVQYSMRGALAYSVNTVSVKLINRAGIGNTIRLAKRMGINSDIPDVPSIALGSSEISLMEMTGAYACLANDGLSSHPFFIKAIADREGNTFKDFKPEASGERALAQETAQMIRQMLQSVVHEGTASRLRWKYGVYNDIAAKTGTTQSNADGWFMAMTPNLVMGTWVGADDPRIRFRDTRLGQGSNTALPVVAFFLRQLNADPQYKKITKAKFPSVTGTTGRKLNCDLYEINDDLWTEIEKSLQTRDSLIRVDTLNTPPPETFLQTLYNRKRRIALLSQVQTQAQAEPGRTLNR